jgi:hypothetical protein
MIKILHILYMKMRMELLSIIILFLVGIVNCELGIDSYSLQTYTTYKCVKDQGYSFVILKAFYTYGAVDT